MLQWQGFVKKQTNKNMGWRMSGMLQLLLTKTFLFYRNGVLCILQQFSSKDESFPGLDGKEGKPQPEPVVLKQRRG